MIEISKLEKELHKKGYVIDKTPEIKSLNYLQNKVFQVSSKIIILTNLNMKG